MTNGRHAAGVARPHLLAALVVGYSLAGVTSLAVATPMFPLFHSIELSVAPEGIDAARAGLLLWAVVCLGTTTQGMRAEGQVPIVFWAGPVMAAGLLGGPAAAGWVALLGTIPFRDARIGTPPAILVALHGVRVLAATIAATVVVLIRIPMVGPIHLAGLVAILVGMIVMVVIEEALALLVWHAQTGRPPKEGFAIVSRADWNLAALAEACLAWLAAMVYQWSAWWAPFLLIVVDVAASRSMAHHHASWRLRHSEVTGLPSRVALDERWMDLSRAGSTSIWAFYLDLDGFKAVNDTHNHHVGDQVLREVGRRLAALADDEVFVSHLHGDEFFVLASGLADDAEAQAFVHHLRAVIEPAIRVDEMELSVSATVGIHHLASPAPREWGLDDLGDAMRRADEAMAANKLRTERRSGGDRRREVAAEA